MPGLTKFVNGDTTPFGKNNFLRSTQPGSYLTDSRTVASASFPTEIIDGNVQKVLQPGEALAKITSGDDIGKFGVFQLGVTDGRQLVANLCGINKSFFPYQLMDRDVEAANCYDASVVQAWCTIRDATGARIPLSNTVADALRTRNDLNILFK